MKCAPNMVFKTINNVLYAYCIQECVCDENSQQEGDQCIPKVRNEFIKYHCNKNLFIYKKNSSKKNFLPIKFIVNIIQI